MGSIASVKFFFKMCPTFFVYFGAFFNLASDIFFPYSVKNCFLPPRNPGFMKSTRLYSSSMLFIMGVPVSRRRKNEDSAFSYLCASVR